MALNKTHFTFIDINNNTSTLTLDKFVAEDLYKNFDDVHKWVQNTYDCFSNTQGTASRRAIGDAIRIEAWKVAMRNLPADF